MYIRWLKRLYAQGEIYQNPVSLTALWTVAVSENETGRFDITYALIYEGGLFVALQRLHKNNLD